MEPPSKPAQQPNNLDKQPSAKEILSDWYQTFRSDLIAHPAPNAKGVKFTERK